MGDRLGDLLGEKRREFFVGRTRELEHINTYLQEDTPQQLIYLYGPAGIGKTMLLQECSRQARRRGFELSALDGQRCGASSSLFLSKLRSELGLEDDQDLSTWQPSNHSLLTIDSFEHLSALEGWLVQEILPCLPSSLTVIVAGRGAPYSRWIHDPGWRGVMTSFELKELNFEETRTYLMCRSVSEGRYEEAFAISHGHPLTLSLIADVLERFPDAELPFSATPELAQFLLGQFIDDVPSYDHRLVLWTASIVEVTTQRLLSDVLEIEDVTPLLDWLRGLSFAQTTRSGVVLHDIVKDVLRTDLMWRDEGLASKLCVGVLDHHLKQFDQLSGERRCHAVSDFMTLSAHLSRPEPRVWEPYRFGKFRAAPALEEHWRSIEDIVERYEGKRSLEILRFWRERGVETFVFSSKEHPVDGFLMVLHLEKVSVEDIARDPGARPIMEHLEKSGRFNRERSNLFFRFWMARESYQSLSECQTRIFQFMVETLLVEPKLDYALAVHHDPEFWMTMPKIQEIEHFTTAKFSLDGRVYGIFGHRYCDETLEAYLRRSIRGSIGVVREPPPLRQMISKVEFAKALKTSLRQCDRLDLLGTSPLLATSMVKARCPEETSLMEKTQTLVELIIEQSRVFQECERDCILYEILDKTYFHRTTKQTVAASELNLSFGTYRRYLSQAIERLTLLLWDVEQKSIDPFDLLASS